MSETFGSEPWPSPWPDHLVPIIRTHDWLGLADDDRCGECFIRLDMCTEPCPGSSSVRCPDCGCVEPPTSAFCWRCGAGLDSSPDTDNEREAEA